MAYKTILARGQTQIQNMADGGCMIVWTDGDPNDPDVDSVSLPLDPEGRKVIGRDLLGQGITPGTADQMPNGQPPGAVIHRRRPG